MSSLSLWLFPSYSEVLWFHRIRLLRHWTMVSMVHQIDILRSYIAQLLFQDEAISELSSFFPICPILTSRVPQKHIELFLDDIREAPPGWDVVRTVQEFKDYILKHGVQDKIAFDHDLGTEETGYDAAKWLVDMEYEIKSFIAHSANPVGRKNIESLPLNWKKHCES